MSLKQQTGLHIAFLLPSLKFGGGERVALNLAHAFKLQGVRVDFLLMSLEGEFLNEAQINFRVIDLDCGRTWRLPCKLMVYLWRERPNGLISSFWKLNLCACLARLVYPWVRLALWEHSPPSLSRNSPTVLYSITTSILYVLATRVVAVSSGVESDIRRITIGMGERLKVIFNAITPPKDQNNRISSKERQTVIWVGRLDTPKNPQLILDAFAKLPKDHNIILNIIGDGPLKHLMTKHAEDLGLSNMVRFLGFQPNPYNHMQEANLLVLTSDREGLPTVLVEALYCGLPIVSTDCGGGIRDILLDSVYGKIVPIGDADIIANAILQTLNNPPDSQNQIQAAQRFKPNLIAEQFLTALKL